MTKRRAITDGKFKSETATGWAVVSSAFTDVETILYSTFDTRSRAVCIHTFLSRQEGDATKWSWWRRYGHRCIKVRIKADAI